MRLFSRPVAEVKPSFGVPQDLTVPFHDAGGRTGSDLINSIVDSDEYELAAQIFATHPYWVDSIFSGYGASLIYSLIRNMRPATVAEIGSFMGKTAFGMAHALNENGVGHLHTVGPFDSHHFLPRYAEWPEDLQQRTSFCPGNSATFYMESDMAERRFDLTLVDGHHDYEFALFDIQCAAKRTNPGGIILVDNIAQAGPFFAAIDFMAANPDWKSGGPLPIIDSAAAYDPSRTTVPGADLIVLVAPSTLSVGKRPTTFGTTVWTGNQVSGVKITAAEDVEFKCQCILRSFGSNGQHELISEGTGTGIISFPTPLVSPLNDKYTVEIWISAAERTVLLELPTAIP
jgi:hypothetical protein